MTAPVSGLDAPTDGLSSVLSRIAELQQQIAGVRSGRPPTASFASTLSSAASPAGLSPDSSDASSALFSATGGPAASGISAYSAAVPTSTGGAHTGGDVVADAQSYLGVPYVFAGTTRAGLDCSGLVQRVYNDLGVSLPRIAADQAKVGTPVASLADAKPGDILAFGDPAYHVAIYIGDSKMIAAPQPGENVKVQSVYETPSTIRRIFTTPSVSPSLATSAAGRSPAVMAFEPQFAAAEGKYSLPSGMLSAVAQQESGGNTTAVSPAGALGLMQLMPGTAASLGVNPYNPAQAIDGAARLLASNLSQFGGSIPLALAAYNAGAGAVQRYGGVPPYAETQNYVKRITAMMGVAA